METVFQFPLLCFRVTLRSQSVFTTQHGMTEDEEYGALCLSFVLPAVLICTGTQSCAYLLK